MNKLSRYFFSKLIINTLIILFTTTVLLIVIQSTKFLDLIIGRGMPIKYLVYITITSMPSIWNELIPIATFISIIFTWQSLLNNNETVVMQSCGLSPLQISKPTLYIGLLSSFICLLFSLFIINTSYIQYVKLSREISNNFNIKIIGTNKFIQLTPEITLYVGNTLKDGRLTNVLIDNDTPEQEVTIYTNEATVVKEKNLLKLLLKKGSIQKLDKQTKATTFVNFDFYVLNVTPKQKGTDVIRDSAKKMYLWELILFKKLKFVQDLQKNNLATYKQRVTSFTVEFNKRISNVILAISFSIIIAFFFSRSVFNRSMRFLPTIKSLLTCLIIKLFCVTILINTYNIYLIIVYYTLIILLDVYLLSKIIKPIYYKAKVKSS
ncbi:LptF/LptG family permease [Rickettsiales bacterium LUAb2]